MSLNSHVMTIHDSTNHDICLDGGGGGEAMVTVMTLMMDGWMDADWMGGWMLQRLVKVAKSAGW